MKRRALFRAGALAASWAFAACTSGGFPVLAPRNEYALYRESRVAPSIDARLAAAQRYLRQNPRGRFEQRVKAWFEPAEARFFERAYHSAPELERYLRALPDGPHAKRAAERLAELALARQYAERREARQSERFAATLKALAEADAGRRNLGRQVQTWLSRLLSLGAAGGWGARTSELPHEFIFAYRMQEPKAVCAARKCVKSMRLGYAVPTPAGLKEREVELLVVLYLKDGGVRGASILGKALFTRLGEALLIRAIDDDDPQARAEAIARSVQFLQNSLQTELPFDACAQPVVSPVVVHRRCRGLNVVAIAGETAVDLDRIEVTPFVQAAPEGVEATQPAASSPEALPAPAVPKMPAPAEQNGALPAKDAGRARPTPENAERPPQSTP